MAVAGVEVEVEFSPLYVGQPLFADIDTYLRRHQFVLWRLGGLTHYSEDPTAQRLNRQEQTYYDTLKVASHAGGGRLMRTVCFFWADASAGFGGSAAAGGLTGGVVSDLGLSPKR